MQNNPNYSKLIFCATFTAALLIVILESYFTINMFNKKPIPQLKEQFEYNGKMYDMDTVTVDNKGFRNFFIFTKEDNNSQVVVYVDKDSIDNVVKTNGSISFASQIVSEAQTNGFRLDVVPNDFFSDCNSKDEQCYIDLLKSFLKTYPQASSQTISMETKSLPVINAEIKTYPEAHVCFPTNYLFVNYNNYWHTFSVKIACGD